jgi:hypothetical protein
MGVRAGAGGSDEWPERPAFCALSAVRRVPKKKVPTGDISGGRGARPRSPSTSATPRTTNARPRSRTSSGCAESTRSASAGNWSRAIPTRPSPGPACCGRASRHSSRTRSPSGSTSSRRSRSIGSAPTRRTSPASISASPHQTDDQPSAGKPHGTRELIELGLGKDSRRPASRRARSNT